MKKLTVEECERISISTIYHHLIRSISNDFPDLSLSAFNVILDQKLEDISKSSIRTMGSLKILLTKTMPNFGGVRYWFLCPGCNRRVGILYKPVGEIFFKCRHCHNLTYQSAQAHDSRLVTVLNSIKGGADSDLLGSYLQNKRKLRWKIIDKGRFQWPPPRIVRDRKEDSAYDKYVRPLIER